jgi:undecaprenyl-diphosphatase
MGVGVENILDWGVNVVLWCQQFSPGLDIVFKSFTFLGNEAFYLLFMPLIYWCFDRRMGARLLVIFLFSAYVNSAAKVIADQPRPFNYDTRVKAIVPAEGGGFPSGHTQNSVVVWAYLAYCLNKKLVWMVAGLLMVAIPLSRIYLGVHFPIDIFGGYLIGLLVLIVFFWVAPAAEAWLWQQKLGWQLIVAVLLPLILLLASPNRDSGCLTAAATLLGCSTGIVLERHWVRFRSKGYLWQRTLRYLLGIIVLFALWGGLRLAFHDLEPDFLFRVVRYALVGLWSGLGAPWMFSRLKLVETENVGVNR